MTRALLIGVFGAGALVAGGCGDDGGSQPPETVIDEAPEALTRETHARFEFRSNLTTNTFECQVDNGVPQNCESPFEVDVVDGPHTFVVTARFGARMDGSPAMHEWTVDSTPPDTMITVSPPVLDNATNPSFEFMATDLSTGLTFECSLDGGAFEACTSPHPVTVGQGEHTFAVRGLDPAGNVDESPASTTWTVSLGPPDTIIVAGPTDGSTSGPAVTFMFSSADTTATFECSLDAATFGECFSPLTLAALTDGAHSFAVRAVGEFETDDSPAERAWTVDAVAPIVTITSGPTDPSNDTTPTWAFTSADTAATFECSIDGAAFATCTSPFTPATPLLDGDRTFAVRATDAVGNVGTPATSTYTLDTGGPAVMITTAPLAISNDTTPTVVFTVEASATVIECQLDAGAFAACTSPFTTTVIEGAHTISVRARDAAGNMGGDSATFTVDTTAPTVTITMQPSSPTNDNTATIVFTTGGSPTTTTCRVDGGAATACIGSFTTAALADGSHTIVVAVTDGAGNTGSAMAMFTVDTTAPTVMITTGPTGLTNDSTPTFGFSATGSPTVTECRFDTQAFATCASSFTAPSALGDGMHTFEVRVRDGASNMSNDTQDFTVDATAPTVTITGQPLASSNDQNPRVTFTTTGSPTTITCRLDSGTPVNCTSPHMFTGVADGSHTITVTVTDTAGNPGSATTSAFIIDTVAPAITITGGPTGLTNDSTPTFTFTVTGATVIECRVDAQAFAACTTTFTPATALGEGPHTFDIRAADAAGNSDTDARAFTVDTMAPTVTITAQPLAVSNNNDPAVSFTTAGSPTTITCRLDTGTAVPCTSPHTFMNVVDGAHTITVIVADAATNSSMATTNSFTIDTVGPTVTIAADPPTGWPVNYFDFAFTAPGATITECSMNGAAFATCTSPVSITANYSASNTFVVRGRDAAGNLAQDSATWTPAPGLVLHYQWEKGSTANTSPLEAVPALSPGGSTSQPIVGGWAGAALGRNIAAHTYGNTYRPLTSSPGGTYTAGFWVRSFGGNGTVFTTRGGNGGLEVRVNDGALIVTTIEQNGTAVNAITQLPGNAQWVHIGLVTTGPSKDLIVFVNGNQVAIADGIQAHGFDLNQKDLIVGGASGLDLDDLRFYNVALTSSQMCSLLARGVLSPASGQCVSLSPVIEFDFETANNLAFNTGTTSVPANGFGGFAATTFNLGGAVQSVTTEANLAVNGLFRSYPSRALSFNFRGGVPANNNLLRWVTTCGTATCGIVVQQVGADRIVVTATTDSGTGSVVFGNATSGANSIVLANGQGKLVVYVNTQEQVIDMGGGDVFQQAGNFLYLPNTAHTFDELEWWPQDISTNAEWLCQNGWGGEWHSRNNTCLRVNHQ